MPESKPPGTETAIRRGLDFLAKRQEADGSFISYSSASRRPFRRVRSWRTVFVPALILASLSHLDQPEAQAIRKKLAGFLLAQKDGDWSFNYWARSAPEYKTESYPNDLDDTFCALAGLYLHDASIIDAAALARIVKLLLATEADVGGPYRTWLVPNDSRPVWLDVDLAVNSNIAYFLSLAGNRLPRLDGLMGEAITKDSFQSPYYPNQYAFIYYFARAYRGPYEDRLLRRARNLHKMAATDLDRALCLAARVRLGDTQDLGLVASDLLTGQRRDGSWPAATFYADPVKEGKLYFSGAPALTTAFALEALELYRRSGRKAVGSDDRRLFKTPPGMVLKMAEEQCRDLGPDLRSESLSLLEKVAASKNGLEIIGLAAAVRESLAGPPGRRTTGFVEMLGLANLFGWLAYTIYDDFLDGEGQLELVPVANVALRRSLDIFSSALPSDETYKMFVRRTFDTMDSANAWELAHCRFEIIDGRLTVDRLPRYGDLSKLADRSAGHALPLVAVLAAAGKGPDTAACRHLLEAFHHYLIARQLNDDAHDWPEDLRAGRITPVVAGLLKELQAKPGEHQADELLAAARPLFWHSTLIDTCRLMRRHIRLARQSLGRSNALKPYNVITDLLDGLEASVADTLHQQGQAEDFLRYYKDHSKKGAKT